MSPVLLQVNGVAREVACTENDTLLHVLRAHLGLRGTRFGCGQEACGACMVLIDGVAVPSCTAHATALAGLDIVTIEGLSTPDGPSRLQQAVLDEQAGQCGYCLSGIIIAATALLRDDPSPTRSKVAAALDRNLCRCGAHNRILRAVLRTADAMP
jgi:nicotinate dehydrogenase subunit A